MVTMGIRRRFLLAAKHPASASASFSRSPASSVSTAGRVDGLSNFSFRTSQTEFNWRALRSVRYTQGFLSTDSKISTSVRIEERGAFLTLGCQPEGVMNAAIEYPIPVADAHHLLTSCAGPKLERISRRFCYGPHFWRIDEYVGENHGLIIAEVELGEEVHLAAKFDPPHWVGEEITGDPNYQAQELLASPYITRTISSMRIPSAPAALQPCPFCGAAVSVALTTTEKLRLLDPKAWVFHLVSCQPDRGGGGCGAHGPWADYPEQAADLWNQRSNLQLLAQLHVQDRIDPSGMSARLVSPEQPTDPTDPTERSLTSRPILPSEN